MATTIKSVTGSVFTVIHDGVEHAIDLGKGEITPKGGAALALGTEDASLVFGPFLETVKENALKLDDATKTALQDYLTSVTSVHANNEVTFKEVVTGLKEAKKLEKSTSDITQELLKTPDAEKFLTLSTRKGLIGKVDFTKLENLQAAQEKFKTLIMASAPDTAQIKALLIDHADFAQQFVENIEKSHPHEMFEVSKKLNISDIDTLITTPIKEAANKATAAAKDIIAKSKTVKSLEAQKKPDAEAVKKAKEAFTKAEEEFTKSTTGEFGHKAAEMSKLTTSEMEEFAKASPKAHGHYQAQLKKAGVALEKSAETAKDGRSWGAKLFLKSEEKIAELAKASPEKELSAFSKISKAKAGAWVAGTVAVAYLAGIGRKPEGKYTQMVAAPDQQQGAVRA